MRVKLQIAGVVLEALSPMLVLLLAVCPVLGEPIVGRYVGLALAIGAIPVTVYRVFGNLDRVEGYINTEATLRSAAPPQ